MQPVQDNIVVNNVFSDTKDAWGVFQAVVVSIGGNVTCVNPGDKILFRSNFSYFKYKKSTNDTDFETLHVIREHDVIGVITKKDIVFNHILEKK